MDHESLERSGSCDGTKGREEEGAKGSGLHDSGAAEEDTIDGGKSEPQGFIYFIETDDGKHIKIGFTTNPRLRLTTIRGMAKLMYRCDSHLAAIIPGNREMERELHRRFADVRDISEWYHNGGDLKHHIENIAKLPMTTTVARDPILTCQRCGHKWTPRKDGRPLQCPTCKQPKWDTPSKWAGSKKKLSPRRRKQIARHAAEARWGKKGKSAA